MYNSKFKYLDIFVQYFLIFSVLGLYMTSLLAFSVGLVSIFGVWRDEDTRFPDFEAAIKKLFWIIFDPGKEEYTDIGPQETDCPEKEVPEGHIVMDSVI